MLGEDRRQGARELLERAREVGVVLVRVPDDEPRGEDHRHRLGAGERERLEEAGVRHPPAPALAPDRCLDLVLEDDQVAVDGPLRDARQAGDLCRRDAGIAVGLQDPQHGQEPRQPVALALDARAVVERVEPAERLVVGHRASLSRPAARR